MTAPCRWYYSAHHASDLLRHQAERGAWFHCMALGVLCAWCDVPCRGVWLPCFCPRCAQRQLQGHQESQNHPDRRKEDHDQWPEKLQVRSSLSILNVRACKVCNESCVLRMCQLTDSATLDLVTNRRTWVLTLNYGYW